MNSINILITRKRPKIELEYISRSLGEGYNIIVPNSFTEEEMLKDIEKVDVLLGDFVTKSMLDNGKIKLIQVPQAGIENLDIDVVKKYSIPVCNSHSNALSVAESAVALLLSVAKKIPYHDRIFREGNWNNVLVEDTEEALSTYGSYVYGKTVGFIGYGHIGRRIGKLLSGFDCKYMAIVNDKYKKYEELDFIGDRSDLHYVLSRVDYLIVAAPLTKETEGMINMSNIVKLKNTAYIINISRGKVIEEGSLYYMLKNNLIRGAAIDAWYNYPKETEYVLPSVDYDFHKLKNIIMSPHRADLIYDKVPYLDHAIDNIRALKEGKELINVLDIKRGY